MSSCRRKCEGRSNHVDAYAHFGIDLGLTKRPTKAEETQPLVSTERR